MQKVWLVLLPLLLVLGACRTGVTMWDSCTVPAGTDPTGTDGAYVLVCRDGRWEPVMTNDEFVAMAQDRPVTVAPLPTAPAQPPVQPSPAPVPTTAPAPTTTAPPSTTIPPAPEPAATTVATGSGFACAAMDGAARCWGANGYGQLGIPSSTYQSDTPVTVAGLTTGVTAISAGANFACAIVDGGAKCWGQNSYGQLGIPSSTAYSSDTPVTVAGLTSGVTAISAGTNFACAAVDGAAKCWGQNSYGQLGTPSSTYSSDTPITVAGLTTGVTAIATGSTFACATVDGSARCWGQNSYGQLGTPSSTYSSDTPITVAGLTAGVTAIATGPDFACAIVDGGAECWGTNGYGQLGTPSSTAYSSPTPLSVPGLTSGVTAIAAGANFACAVVDGAAKCWGQNSDGKLGTPTTTFQSDIPITVAGLTSGATAIATGPGSTMGGGMGFNFACAVVEDAVKCWGSNSSGQLGTPNSVTYQSHIPLTIPL